MTTFSFFGHYYFCCCLVVLAVVFSSTSPPSLVVECRFASTNHHHYHYGNFVASTATTWWSSLTKQQRNSNIGINPHHEPSPSITTGSSLLNNYRKFRRVGTTTVSSPKKVAQASILKNKKKDIESDIRGGTVAAGHIVKTMTARRMETFK
jgi:hypothetical protein